MVTLKFVAVLLLLSTQVIAKVKTVKELHSWKILVYGFLSMKDRDDAINSGHYTNETRYPVDVGIGHLMDGSMKTIVTVPRYIADSPYSLAMVSNESTSNGPVLYPYPNYSSQNQHNSCSRLTSVERVAVDECNQLWAIDSGMVKGKQVCPPQLVVFNLTNDQMVHRHTFDSKMYTKDVSLFVNLVLDTADPMPNGMCRHTKVYIADSQTPGLIVYDTMEQSAWRIENEKMHPVKKWEKVCIANESFDIGTDGINGLALSPRTDNEERFLYFHPYASEQEIRVPLKTINNQATWDENRKANPDEFKVVGERNVQAMSEAMDCKGNLFTSTADPLSVFAWNTREAYNMNKVVANNKDQLQFMSGMKVQRDHHGKEYLYMMSDKFQKYKTGTLDPNEINYRIMCCSIEDLLSEDN